MWLGSVVYVSFNYAELVGNRVLKRAYGRFNTLDYIMRPKLQKNYNFNHVLGRMVEAFMKVFCWAMVVLWFWVGPMSWIYYGAVILRW